MKIAILHYHLNRGGVTQVIKSHIRSLPDSEIVILHGGSTQGWLANDRHQLIEVPELAYDASPELNVEYVAKAISRALSAVGFHAGETVIHVHNHALGKNVSLPGALARLAEVGYRLLLQIHDYAEDLRPANYNRFRVAMQIAGRHDVPAYLYPNSSRIHYAFLNSRDLTVMRSAGLAKSQSHLLPNPVPLEATLPDFEQSRRKVFEVHGLSPTDRLVVYPVRGIRRKNLGELLLWSALAKNTVFGITLPATSESESPAYQRWQATAKRLDLPVLFEMGLRDEVTFHENLAASESVITTSLAEGFGLVFLESWLRGRPLIGRDIPEITRDFVDQGLRLDHLGSEVRIPLSWIDQSALTADYFALLEQLHEAYDIPLTDVEKQRVHDEFSGSDIDFARLPAHYQIHVLEHLVTSRDAVAQVLGRNEWLAESLSAPSDSWATCLEHNAAVVHDRYSLEATTTQLRDVYQALADSVATLPSTQLPEPQNILHTFLRPERLRPVQIEA